MIGCISMGHVNMAHSVLRSRKSAISAFVWKQWHVFLAPQISPLRHCICGWYPLKIWWWEASWLFPPATESKYRFVSEELNAFRHCRIAWDGLWQLRSTVWLALYAEQRRNDWKLGQRYSNRARILIINIAHAFYANGEALIVWLNAFANIEHTAQFALNEIRH